MAILKGFPPSNTVTSYGWYSQHYLSWQGVQIRCEVRDPICRKVAEAEEKEMRWLKEKPLKK